METLREKLEELEKAVKNLQKAISKELGHSVLSGKCAIQVNNEREFKLLMEHYESKGWTSFDGELPSSIPFDRIGSVRYCPDFGCASAKEYHKNTGHTIIPFSDFATEAGIKVPVFMMDDKNGIHLYIGDSSFVPQVNFKDEYSGEIIEFKIDKFSYKSDYARFSTRAAAEAWIREQNKPKETIVSLYSLGYDAVMCKEANVILIRINNEVVAQLHPSDLEDMLHALKSLQCDTNK